MSVKDKVLSRLGVKQYKFLKLERLFRSIRDHRKKLCLIFGEGLCNLQTASRVDLCRTYVTEPPHTEVCV